MPKPIVLQELPLTVDELLATLLVLAPARGAQILDSGGARREDEARFLIAGFDPFETVEAQGDQLTSWRRAGDTTSHVRGDVLALLDERLKSYRATVPNSPFFTLPGACIASFSYDLARRFLRLHSIKPRRIEFPEPDATLAFFDTLVIHDYARGTTHISGARVEETRAALLEAARRAVEPARHETLEMSRERAVKRAVNSNFTRAEYLAAVERIRTHIYAGDIYQANLTQQLTCPLAKGDGVEQIFLRLRHEHPASFAAFLRRAGDLVISASPERFLRVEVEAQTGERRVEAWPIKGTRPRGTNTAEDERLRAELLASEKDRAENTMIVDLLRNDLGRVCRYGSVEVIELCALQEHPTLFHLVSKVRGTLRPEVSAGELLRATFPCGSITGAPKLRAIEIIDEVETAPRGLSMGAIGYFSFDGTIDLNVAIRTMIVRDGAARFNVGGGIVADSDPASEYDESLVKARALLRALRADDGQR